MLLLLLLLSSLHHIISSDLIWQVCVWFGGGKEMNSGVDGSDAKHKLLMLALSVLSSSSSSY